MSKVILTSDWHFGNNIHGRIHKKSGIPSRIVDKGKLVSWITDYAIKHEIEDVFVLGDVFETSRPTTLEYDVLSDLLKKAAKAQVRYQFIYGNHDDTNITNTPSAVRILTKASGEEQSAMWLGGPIQIGKTLFYPMPYVNRVKWDIKDKPKAVLDAFEELHRHEESLKKRSFDVGAEKWDIQHRVALMHELFAGTKIGAGDYEMPLQFTVPLVSLPNWITKVFSGHIHKPQELHEGRVVYVGSIDARNFGEADQVKRIIIYDTDTGKWESVPLPVQRPFKELVYVCKLDEDQANKFLMEDIEAFIGEQGIGDAVVKFIMKFKHPLMSQLVNRAEVEDLLYQAGAHKVFAVAVVKEGSEIKKRLDVSSHGMTREQMLIRYLETDKKMHPIHAARILGKGILVMDAVAKV